VRRRLRDLDDDRLERSALIDLLTEAERLW